MLSPITFLQLPVKTLYMLKAKPVCGVCVKCVILFFHHPNAGDVGGSHRAQRHQAPRHTELRDINRCNDIMEVSLPFNISSFRLYPKK